MSDHQYFTVEGTALTIPKRGATAIYCGDAPRANADGSTSYSCRAPLLILPPDLFEDGDEEIRKVAALLNANAHLFFSSAAKPSAPPEVLALVEAMIDVIDACDLGVGLSAPIHNARSALAKWSEAYGA